MINNKSSSLIENSQENSSKVSCPSGIKEIVLYQHDMARKAHMDLFSFDDNRYLIVGSDITASIIGVVDREIDKLHISVEWENLLKIALWNSAEVQIGDALSLLKKTGVSEADINPLRNADVSDLFPWLYYGKKFDIMRKACNSAKARAENMINIKSLRVFCHLVAGDTGRIVASSL